MQRFTCLVWLLTWVRPLLSFQVHFWGASSPRTSRSSTNSHERRSRPCTATAPTALLPTADNSSKWRRRQDQLPWSSATATALSVHRKTELEVPPRATDDRTVQEWLQFDEQELDKIRSTLQSVRACDVDERLGLVADGTTDSILVS